MPGNEQRDEQGEQPDSPPVVLLGVALDPGTAGVGEVVGGTAGGKVGLAGVAELQRGIEQQRVVLEMRRKPGSAAVLN